MERVPTGIDGLDEMIGGGIPRQRVVLVCGGPGSGKTVLAMRFLLHGAEKLGEPGLFVTFDETPEHIREDMKGFGVNLESLENAKKIGIVDMSPMLHLSAEDFKKAALGSVKVPEFTIESVSHGIMSKVKEIGAKRIAVDSITGLTVLEPDLAKVRRNMVHLIGTLMESGCTSLVTAELQHDAMQRKFQLEEYLTHGAIILQTLSRAGELVRALQIEKMRGVQHDTQPRPYRITNQGITVYAKEKVL